MTMKKRILALVLATSMVGLVGCGGSGAENSAASDNTEVTEVVKKLSQETDIVAAVSVDFTTMDPLDTSDTLSGGLQRLMMDGLFGFDEDMKLIPMLATGYEANEDATEFVFTLREGISFTDGVAWNAEAAKANFDRWADKTTGMKRTSLLSNILDTTEIVDEYTVKVTTSASFGALISTLAHPACVTVSPAQIEAGPAACAAMPVGTGQYTFVEWVAGEKAVVALNTDWWGYDADICGGTALVDAEAGFNTITFRPVSENATRVAMMQSGEAHLTWTVPEESLQLLQNDSNLEVTISDGIVVRFMTMNTQKAPFDNVLVRQAVNYAIDNNAYCAVVKNGLGTPATSLLGPAVQFYKGNESYGYDLEKAKELLAEAGYADGFSTTLMCSSTTSNLKQAEFVQQQLALAGINVEIVALENAVLNERVQNVTVPGSEAEVDMYIAGWSPSTGDADWGIRPLVGTESFPPNNYNVGYYDNARVDELLYDALATADSETRATAYAEIQDIVWEEVPAVYFCVDSNSIVTSADLVDVKILADGSLNIRNGKLA